MTPITPSLMEADVDSKKLKKTKKKNKKKPKKQTNEQKLVMMFSICFQLILQQV